MQLFRSLSVTLQTLAMGAALLGTWDCNPPDKGEPLTEAEAALAALSEADVADLAPHLEYQLQIFTKALAKENDIKTECREYPFYINIEQAVSHLHYKVSIAALRAEFDPVASKYILRYKTRAWGPPRRDYTFEGQRTCLATHGRDERMIWRPAQHDTFTATGCKLLHDRYQKRLAPHEAVAYQDPR